MELTTLARPYAKAAFAFAQEANDVNNWSEMLSNSAAVVANEAVQKALNSPDTSSAQQAEILEGLCAEQLNEAGQNFIRALSENKRLTLLAEIAELFEIFKAELDKSVDVDITSAFPLDSEQEQKLQQALSTRLGRKVNVESTVDQSLIGGLVIKAGDLVIDGSVRAKLSKLQDAMNS